MDCQTLSNIFCQKLFKFDVILAVDHMLSKSHFLKYHQSPISLCLSSPDPMQEAQGGRRQGAVPL